MYPTTVAQDMGIDPMPWETKTAPPAIALSPGGYGAERNLRAIVNSPNPDPVQAAMRERAAILKEMGNVKDPASVAAMRYQLDDLNRVIGSGGAGVQTATPPALLPPGGGAGRGSVNPTPPAIAVPPAFVPGGTDFSPAEKTEQEAARVTATETAKADVSKAQDKQKALNSGNDMLQIIDKVLNHPGRETVTGLSGLVDPRNYVPGTQASNFKVALGQLKGQTFLQAFTSLKGAGAITEQEGAKATAALSRLDTAQSDDEFKLALEDLRSVVDRGLKVARGEKVPDAPLPLAGSMPTGWTVKAK
jgi:hypothetical protein